MGYIARQVRKLLGTANVWSGQQTFAGGISGAIQPGSGKTFYVDATSGSVGAAATSWSTAEKSIEGAYGRCVDGRGDTIYIQSRGSSSAATTSYLSSTLTWAKSGITVIGLAAPTQFGRARIANLSTALTLVDLISVTGDNNQFHNLNFYNGGSNVAAVGCVRVSGNRNYFGNCHMVGGNHATPKAAAGQYDIMANGAEELRCVGCTFGSDTIISAAANTCVLFDDTAYRCEFIDCRFMSYSDTAGKGHVKTADATAVGRNILFSNCVFDNFSANSPSALTAVAIGTAPTSGLIMFHQCSTFGFAAWSAANDAYYVANGAVEAATGGVGVQVA
jgi:hypothetical protein